MPSVLTLLSGRFSAVCKTSFLEEVEYAGREQDEYRVVCYSPSPLEPRHDFSLDSLRFQLRRLHFVCSELYYSWEILSASIRLGIQDQKLKHLERKTIKNSMSPSRKNVGYATGQWRVRRCTDEPWSIDRLQKNNTFSICESKLKTYTIRSDLVF